LPSPDARSHLDALIRHLRSVSGWNQTGAGVNAERLADAASSRSRAASALRSAGQEQLASRLEDVQLPAPCPLWIVRPARVLEYLSARAALRAVEQIRAAATTPGTPLPPAMPNHAEDVSRWSMIWLPAVILFILVIMSLTNW
jgi:hypothetical protein